MNSKGQAWDPSKINARALTILALRTAQALSPTRKGVPIYPETQQEKAFSAKFREEFQDPQAREAALESTLNYFVGGALQGAIDDLRFRTKHSRRAYGRRRRA